MKRFAFGLLPVLLFISCSKDSVQPNNAAGRLTTPASGVNAVPISDGWEIDVYNGIWNFCTSEPVIFSGKFRLSIRGMVSDNKVTYVLHANYSDIKGIGLYTGTRYVSTGTFNYNNTDNYGDQLLFQQNQVLKFTALGGADGSFTTINDWHLTVNANGEVVKFTSTFGDVTTCK
jgi:hypothetical protein